MKACRSKVEAPRLFAEPARGAAVLIVVVNKMDLADYSEARFREIEDKYRQFLKTLNLEPRVFIPASARFGENISRVAKK